jgi:hypothetical protein
MAPVYSFVLCRGLGLRRVSDGSGRITANPEVIPFFAFPGAAKTQIGAGEVWATIWAQLPGTAGKPMTSPSCKSEMAFGYMKNTYR